jgi:hypothetical protein
MKLFSTLVCLAFVVCAPASAAIKGCYERRYDAGVMKRHPTQLVTKVSLQFGMPDNDQEDDEDYILFLVRGSKAERLNNYSCKGRSSPLTCTIENSLKNGAPGGSFTLTETADGVIITVSTDLALEILGQAKPYTLKVKNNPAHRIFTLSRDKSGTCEVP